MAFNRLAPYSCAALIIAIVLALPNQASSQETRSLESLTSDVRGRRCPDEGSRVSETTFKEAGCKTICFDRTRNGGDCGEGGLVGYDAACQQEVRRHNEIISAYNRFADVCDKIRNERRIQSAKPLPQAPPRTATTNTAAPLVTNPQQSPIESVGPPPTQKSVPAGSSSALERALERQRAQGRDADSIHTKNRIADEQFVRVSREEKARLDQIRIMAEAQERRRWDEARRREAMRQEQIRLEQEAAADRAWAAVNAMINAIGRSQGGYSSSGYSSGGGGSTSSGSGSASSSSSNPSSYFGGSASSPYFGGGGSGGRTTIPRGASGEGRSK